MADRFSPIAVVGLGALFPGSAEPGGFWRDIISGRDLLTDVPPDRWLIEDYYDPDPTAPDKTYAKRGAFLSPIEFDPLEHGIPPNVVPSTDTSQLLGLIVAKQVLEDATRHRFDKLDRDRVSVVLGITSAQELLVEAASRLQRPVWVKALREEGVPEDEVKKICDRIAGSYTPWQEMTFPGLLGNVVAGRIANRLNLGGTNCVTDAACASALSALTMGVSELRLGDSDLVLVGGVETFNDIFMYMCFSKTPAMSPTGDCRPFSSKADGTMLGEGIGLLALRRLADAECDGDAIYAVIRGIGSSSDGRAKSIYAPVASGQAKALRRAYAAAGYGPDTVEMVEAHATGTKAGDAAEFEGLRTVFDETGRQDRQWCSVGSVKSQIGHTKAAAGAAGMLKAVLSLRHKALPPTIKVDAPGAQLEVEKSPFYLNVEARPWVRDSRYPRRASVSAFGFGGSNFHVALEEYTGTGQRALRFRNFPTELVVLSAVTPEELRSAIAKLRGEADVAGWPRVARLSQESFDAARPARLAVVASSLDDLLAKLGDADKRLAAAPRDAFAAPGGASYAVGAEPGKVAFLFPGQGSQSLNMGRDLALGFEPALAVWDRAAAAPFGETPLHEVVFPKPAFTDASRDALAKRLTATEWAQPAIGGASLALLRLVESLGLRPDSVAGHSFGELVALHAAGALSEADLLRVARQRGELMGGAAAATPGAMLAVAHAADEVGAIVESERLDVVVANHNSPRQVVLAGSVDAIAAAEKVLKARGMTAKKLPVATAFHSPIVAPSSEPFRAFLSGIDVAAPALPVLANETAAPYAASPDAVRDGLARQIANPVRFAQIVDALYARGVRTFVEVGPGAVLTGLVGECLAGRAHTAANLDRKGQHGVTALWNGLARLVVAGVPLAFAKLWDGYRTPAPEAKKPGLRLSLTGATYGKPYPPAGGSAALPKPNPPRPAITPVATPSAVPAAAPVATAAPVEAAVTGTGLDPGWLAAWQEMQRQTADAHAAYQSSMADTHGAFLRASEASFQALHALAGGALPVAPAMTAPAPSPAVAPAPRVAAPAPAGAPPVVAPQVMVPAAGPAAPPAPVVAPPAALSLTPALLDVVAEKTGYPAEMLQLEMELEADLGVDSIKRVEILAALTERVPGLPSIGAGEMGSLRTLGQIAHRLQADAPSATGGVVPAALAAAAVPVAAASADLTPALLAVVAEKTGYPAEMLQLEMELEADLGVDSIKRVEILAALTERVPGLPSIGAGEMGSLRTLGQIAHRLQGDAPQTATLAPHAPASPVAAASLDLTPALLAVVAEKTGYPAEMLQLEMELEADLGVDSIKRVEILAALTERVPGLPSIGAGEMGSLRTLGQIAHRLRGDVPVAPRPAAPAAAQASLAVQPPAAPATAAGSDLLPALLAVVAEKTGYPAEMLQLDMELEADLGVDSIKRVEILASLGELIPGLPQITAGEMAELRTLRQIAGRLAAAVHPHVAAPVAAPIAADLGHYGLELVAVAPVGLPSGGLFTQGPIAITDDGTGVAGALAERLARLGADVKVVAQVAGDEAGAIVLAGLRPVANAEQADAACRDAFEAARRLATRLSDKGGLFVTVQDTGGDLGLAGRSGPRAPLGALAGLAKTAAQEWPLATVRAIDVAPAAEAAAVADRIAAELLHGGFTREVALGADGVRSEPRSVRRDPVAGELPCDERSVVVATGGARGVTADCLLALARRTRARFALLGRTPLTEEPAAARGVTDDRALSQALLDAARAAGRVLTPADLRAEVVRVQSGREVRHTLDALRAAGSEAVYVAADARDGAAVAAALAGVRERFGPITGLVHGAGVLADRLLRDKTLEQFDRVWSTKVVGLRALLTATAADPLRFVALFSSVAGRCGNAGQSDYAMANEALNKVAAVEAAQRPGCRVIALGWGPWDGGMVTPALRARFEARGVPLVTRERGPQMFVSELAQPLEAPSQTELLRPQGRVGAAEVVLGGEPRPEPLASEAAAREARFDLAVNARTEPLLADHEVAGSPVVPAAFALDWFARAALALRPDLRLAALRELKVVRGIRVADFDGQGTRLRLTVREVSNGTGARLALDLRGADGALHYSATADMAREGLAAPTDAIVAAPRTGEPAASLYGEMLFHGPGFQLLRRLDSVSAGGAAAICAGVPEQGWGGRFALDAAAVDGALQLAIVWGRHQAGAHTLPTGLGAFLPRGAFPAKGPLRLELVARQASSLRTVSDVLAFDVAGAPVFELREVEMHAVPAPERKAPALQGAVS